MGGGDEEEVKRRRLETKKGIKEWSRFSQTPDSIASIVRQARNKIQV